jgi:hypothetical protein
MSETLGQPCADSQLGPIQLPMVPPILVPVSDDIKSPMPLLGRIQRIEQQLTLTS